MGLKRATLGHVVLNVRDLKKSERFYRNILGMGVSGRNLRMKMSFLSFGKEHHDVALMELPRGAKRSAGDGLRGCIIFASTWAATKKAMISIPC